MQKPGSAPFLTKPWYSAGQEIPGLMINGKKAEYKVINERAVRASAGLMLVAASLGFIYARLLGIYLPLQIITTVLFFDFVARIFTGLTPLSPTGILGTLLVINQIPEWVSVRQKRFAWSLGSIIALAMSIMTNTGIRGPVPLTLCMICIVLMWLESAAGICLGCKIYKLLVKLKIINQHEYPPEACPGGVCNINRQK